MSPSSTAPNFPEERVKKPPACNPCKARRVLCHPQPGGAPCPRCVERKTECTTTPVPRGRPRKNVQASSVRPHQTIHSLVLHPHPGPDSGTSTDFPELSPEFVAHCFEGLRFNPQYTGHPVIAATSIRADVRAVSFQLHLLPPQSRVLALCSIAYASLSSFHPSVLRDGPRPQSFVDHDFFSSNPELLGCGVRRAPAYRALRSAALKAAWEVGVILQPSTENAASCYLLDLMEQIDFGSAGKPWANAYMGHVRVLAPIWRSSYTTTSAAEWTGFLMVEALMSARSRTPSVVTAQDQLLLGGPEPPSLEALLALLERSANEFSFSFLFTPMHAYLFHVTSLARQLYDTITGDFARTSFLSEVAVLNYLDSLSKMHSILSLLLDRIDMNITAAGTNPPATLDDTSVDAACRAAAYGACCGFSGLVHPFYRELVYRESSDGAPQSDYTRERLRILRAQAHDMTVIAVRVLARGIRYLPKIHYTPTHWSSMPAWAEFAADEADMNGGAPLSPEAACDLETFADDLKLLSYSLDAASTPQTVALIERLEGHVNAAMVSIFLPLDEDWIEGPIQEGDVIFPWHDPDNVPSLT